MALRDNSILVDAILSNSADTIIDQMTKYEDCAIDISCKFTKHALSQYLKICGRFRLYKKIDKFMHVIEKINQPARYILMSRIHPLNITYNSNLLLNSIDIESFIADPNVCAVEKIIVYPAFLHGERMAKNISHAEFMEKISILMTIVEQEDELIKKCAESIIQRWAVSSKLVDNPDDMTEIITNRNDLSLLCATLLERNISVEKNYIDSYGVIAEKSYLELIQASPYAIEFSRKFLSHSSKNTASLIAYLEDLYDYKQIQHKILRSCVKYRQMNLVTIKNFKLAGQDRNVELYLKYYQDNINIQEIKEMDIFIYGFESSTYYILASDYHMTGIALVRTETADGAEKLVELYRTQIVVLENIAVKYPTLLTGIVGQLIIVYRLTCNFKAAVNLYLKYSNYIYRNTAAKTVLAHVLSSVIKSLIRGGFKTIFSLMLPLIIKYNDQGFIIDNIVDDNLRRVIDIIDLRAVDNYDSDDSKFITNAAGTAICVICQDKIVNEAVVECTHCGKYVGHLHCVAKNCVFTLQNPDSAIKCANCNYDSNIKSLLERSGREYSIYNEPVATYEDQIAVPGLC